MRFNSPIFLCFLAFVVAILWVLPVRARRNWLLIASYVFYGSWHYPYLGLLIGSAALNHWGAIWIVRGLDRPRRGVWIVAANVALLGLFKYFEWLAENLNFLARWSGHGDVLPIVRWMLPLGISFYLFEGISYTVDVIRKRERIHSFWDFQLFIAFFPKLVAGPILRGKELLPQIEHPEARLTAAAAFDGVWLITTGLFLKVVLADGLSPQVDDAFARPVAGLSGVDVYLMALAFGLQIYCDFCGYSRIAIGAARLCGIGLVDNFNYPYSARSPVDFWNRWHMSLSRWIRDYLFMPLLGSSTTFMARCRAALIAMALCGIWHGAGWTFVLWGVYHGALLAGYHALIAGRPLAAGENALRGRLTRMWAPAATFALVTLGWILFRSANVTQAAGLLALAIQPWNFSRALPGTFYLHAVSLIVAVWLAPIAARVATAADRGSASATSWRSLGYPVAQGLAVGLMLALSLIYLRGQTSFIYFQF